MSCAVNVVDGCQSVSPTHVSHGEEKADWMLRTIVFYFLKFPLAMFGSMFWHCCLKWNHGSRVHCCRNIWNWHLDPIYIDGAVHLMTAAELQIMMTLFSIWWHYFHFQTSLRHSGRCMQFSGKWLVLAPAICHCYDTLSWHIFFANSSLTQSKGSVWFFFRSSFCSTRLAKYLAAAVCQLY